MFGNIIDKGMQTLSNKNLAKGDIKTTGFKLKQYKVLFKKGFVNTENTIVFVMF